MAALEKCRVLCAHRKGPCGVQAWSETVEGWLREEDPSYADSTPWYVGQPIMITANDYQLGLYNGDTGVIVGDGKGGHAALFERSGNLVELSPNRLSLVETVHAMTVHKAQGSQFDEVVVVLPDAASPLLYRQVLYTAVTRAKETVTLVGSETAIRTAIDNPVVRDSGLRERLWGPGFRTGPTP